MIIFLLRSIFVEGDCGLIVYVKDLHNGKLYPLGIFTGESLRKHTCGSPIYTAVPLQPCLDNIKYDYRQLVSRLQPIASDEYVRNVSPSHLETVTPTGATGHCATKDSPEEPESGYATGSNS